MRAVHLVEIGVSLLDLCDDTLGLVALSVQEEQRDGTRRAHLAHLTELTSCALVCTRLHDALKPALASARAAATSELCGVRRSGTEGELLNLSSSGAGGRECALLALGMASGLLHGVRSIWLQDNKIGRVGLAALARGLRGMDAATCPLRSIALGANAFHAELGGGRGAPPPPALRRALRQLERAADERRVSLRLNS